MKGRYKRQQINITEKDADIISFLEQKPNISQYVIRLIKKDMYANSEEFRTKVIKIINDYCNNNCNSVNTINKQDNFYDAIKGIFEM